MDSSYKFYNQLPKHSLPLGELLKSESCFAGVPKDWHVVVADIQNSSVAVAKGLHNDVNLTATGSIITVLNELKIMDPQLRIPYFFGGDGATFIMPPAIVNQVVDKLHSYSNHILKILKLTLRVGSVELAQVYNENSVLRIAKLKQNNYLTTPVVLGNALKAAEKFIKNSFESYPMSIKDTIELNLKGMECRWDEILPGIESNKIICLLVTCNDETKQAEVYDKILSEIDFIFGNLSERNPITVPRLKLNTSLQKIRKEMYACLGRRKKRYLIQNWLITFFGQYYFKFFKEGKNYLYKVTQLSDSIMLDGSINTVFTGSTQQVNQLKIYLDTLEAEGIINYGIHTTHASIMSCFIQDRDRKHIHFIDGTEGGYTSAAVGLKKKLASLELSDKI